MEHHRATHRRSSLSVAWGGGPFSAAEWWRGSLARRNPSTMLRMVPLPEQAQGGFWSRKCGGTAANLSHKRRVPVAWVARHRRVAVAQMARHCRLPAASLPRHRSLTAASSPEPVASPPQLPETDSHTPNPPKPALPKPAHWPFPPSAPMQPPVHAPGVVA